MATELPKRIHLIGDGRFEEGVAAAAITPGQLVKLDANGALIKHNSIGGPAEAAFALEDALQGKTIDNACTIGDTIPYVIAAKGDVIYAYLNDGENVTPADFLASAGNGNLRKALTNDVKIAAPIESVDLSQSSDDTARIKVRVL